MASDGAREGQRLPAVLRVGSSGSLGLELTWRPGEGYAVSGVAESPGQPAVEVGDVIAVIGNCVLQGLSQETADDVIATEVASAGRNAAVPATLSRKVHIGAVADEKASPVSMFEAAPRPIADPPAGPPVVQDWAYCEGPKPEAIGNPSMVAPAVHDMECPAVQQRDGAPAEERVDMIEMTPKPEFTRLHRMWPGKNRFCCGGLVMTGNPGHGCTTSMLLRAIRDALLGRTRWADCGESWFDWVESCGCIEEPCCTATSPANLCAWSCILLPSALYFGVALPYYWALVHPFLPLASAFFFFLTVGCLCAACCADPGIIPRREVILACNMAEALESELGYNVLGEMDSRQPDVVRMRVPDTLRSRGYRWCHTCRIIRPPRAAHCPDCDNCVLRFDHHCPFVNNCVGQRNYIYFMGFTTSVCCLALWVIPALLWYLVMGVSTTTPAARTRTQVTFQEVDGDVFLRGILITLALAGGGAALLVLLLWVYHLFLICSGITTKEHWRGRRLPGSSEELTVFGRRGPRLYHPRKWVELQERGWGTGLNRWQLKGSDENVVEA